MKVELTDAQVDAMLTAIECFEGSVEGWDDESIKPYKKELMLLERVKSKLYKA